MHLTKVEGRYNYYKRFISVLSRVEVYSLHGLWDFDSCGYLGFCKIVCKPNHVFVIPILCGYCICWKKLLKNMGGVMDVLKFNRIFAK